MSNSGTGVYENLANEYVTQNIDSAAYINGLLKSVVPMRDLESENIYKKALYTLPTVNRKTKKIRKKKSYLTRKEKKKLNLLKVSKTGWDYNEFEPLRQMWLEYMTSYLNLQNGMPKENKNWANFHTILGKADYHGAEMTVIRSKCPNLVGTTGTCILDTKNTFKILSKDNKARTIPKRESIFKFQVKKLEITIFGKYFASRSADRSVKKVKTQMVLDL